MKIGPYSDPQLASTSGLSPVSPPNSVAGASPAPGERQQGVSVKVSPEARSLGGSAGSASSEVDAGKVEAFRAAIAQGSYVVNAGAIADKLLANAQEMLVRSQSRSV